MWRLCVTYDVNSKASHRQVESHVNFYSKDKLPGDGQAEEKVYHKAFDREVESR